jgi:hypothetical protein
VGPALSTRVQDSVERTAEARGVPHCDPTTSWNGRDPTQDRFEDVLVPPGLRVLRLALSRAGVCIPKCSQVALHSTRLQDLVAFRTWWPVACDIFGQISAMCSSTTAPPQRQGRGIWISTNASPASPSTLDRPSVRGSFRTRRRVLRSYFRRGSTGNAPTPATREDASDNANASLKRTATRCIAPKPPPWLPDRLHEALSLASGRSPGP